MIKLAIALLLATVGAALAQVPSPLPPFVYAVTVGTSQAQAIGSNTQRKRLIFLNPSATATVALCPPTQRVGTPPTPIACAVNGAGSVTLPPYGTFAIDAGSPGNQGFGIGTSWNAIASAPSSPLTILEFE